MTAVATAMTTTKATSGGVEEDLKDVGSFSGKKKTAANDDISSDVAGESPPSSLTMAESTATASKAGPAGMVAQGSRGAVASPDDGGGKAVGRKNDVEEAGEYAERQARMRWLSNKRRAANEAGIEAGGQERGPRLPCRREGRAGGHD